MNSTLRKKLSVLICSILSLSAGGQHLHASTDTDADEYVWQGGIYSAENQNPTPEQAQNPTPDQTQNPTPDQTQNPTQTTDPQPKAEETFFKTADGNYTKKAKAIFIGGPIFAVSGVVTCVAAKKQIGPFAKNTNKIKKPIKK